MRSTPAPPGRDPRAVPEGVVARLCGGPVEGVAGSGECACSKALRTASKMLAPGPAWGDALEASGSGDMSLLK